jgi:hypothetical protein
MFLKFKNFIKKKYSKIMIIKIFEHNKVYI